MIRITEGDIHRMVQSSLKRILRESDENNMVLQLIAQEIVGMGRIRAVQGENDCEVEIGDGDIAVVVFEVTSNPYVRKGMRSHDYDVPDDPDSVVDDFDIEITDIVLEDESSIQDNGIVYNALMNVIEIDYDDFDNIPDESERYSDEW